MDVLLNIEKLVSMGQWIYQDEQDAYNIEISSLIYFVQKLPFCNYGNKIIIQIIFYIQPHCDFPDLTSHHHGSTI